MPHQTALSTLYYTEKYTVAEEALGIILLALVTGWTQVLLHVAGHWKIGCAILYIYMYVCMYVVYSRKEFRLAKRLSHSLL